MIGAAFLALFVLDDAIGAEQPAASRSVPAVERTLRVGPICVEGADDMSATAILEHLGFRQGDEIPYHRLREAERRLADLGRFVVDPARGVRPRIIVLPDGEWSGLRIKVVMK